MYLEFFGLRHRPFRADLADIPPFLDQGRKDALVHLEYGLGDNLGFIILTGEIGAGKTTLLGRVMRNLPRDVAPVFLSYAGEPFAEIVAEMTEQIAPKGHKGSGSRLMRFKSALKAQVKQGRRALVVIDDAQNLAVEDLKRICMLANLRLEGRLAVQFLLSGQNELGAKLADPELAQLAQRVAVSCRLEPLDRDGTVKYVLYRLKKAGAGSEPFTKQALTQVYKASRGVPRLINILCETALVYAFAEDSKLVTARIMRQAVDEKRQELAFYFGPGSLEGDKAEQAAPALDAAVADRIERLEAGQRKLAEALDSSRQKMAREKDVLERYLREMLRQERERSDELLTRCATLETQVHGLAEKLKRTMQTRRGTIREIKLGS